MNNSVLCLDIGGSFIKSALSTAEGVISHKRQRPLLATHWADFSAAIRSIIAEYGDALSTSSPVALSCAGVVDIAQDSILASNVPPFQGVKITQTLSADLGRTVVMANDADCFTLAEACYGAAKDLPVVLGIIIGSGIGGGIAIHGKIFKGNQGISAEWGHAPVTPTSLVVQGKTVTLPRLPCGCGQSGCLDTLGGARGIERLHQLLSGESLASQDIVQAAFAEQEQAAMTLAVWVELVSEPLAHAVNILGPHKIVAGGGLASELTLIARLDEAVRRKILLKTDEPLLIPGCHFSDGGLIGASILAHQAS
ncbi:ROK family protein [Phytobacter sp. V91]|uniref:ROK family protein n=1 Tax=Phytobacter sp. V91 TaxID=3369425 RepID=UPI003F5E373F